MSETKGHRVDGQEDRGLMTSKNAPLKAAPEGASSKELAAHPGKHGLPLVFCSHQCPVHRPSTSLVDLFLPKTLDPWPLSRCAFAHRSSLSRSFGKGRGMDRHSTARNGRVYAKKVSGWDQGDLSSQTARYARWSPRFGTLFHCTLASAWPGLQSV
jgi:hypothetical protein